MTVHTSTLHTHAAPRAEAALRALDAPRIESARFGDPAGEDLATRFLLELARALHAAGAPAYRLEDALAVCARRFGERAEFFSTPTSVFAAFGTGPEQRTFLFRVSPRDADLGRLSDLDELVEDVVHGRTSAAHGIRRLASIETSRPRYGRGLTIASFSAISATAAIFFGGGATEVLVSALVGLFLGALGILITRPGLFEPVAAFLAAAASVTCAWLLPGVSDRVMTLAGLIVLVPGLTLTVGMTEVAMRHLSSGTARLASAAATFLSIALGVALGRRVGDLLPGFESVDAFGAPSALSLAVALVIAPLAFTVLFQARRRDAGWILLVGIGGFLAARFGSRLVGPELGSFFGALTVGVAGNAFARWRRRPASVLQVPGLLLLVPGSIGFQSLSSFLAQDVLEGVDAAFRMMFVGAALVGGVFLASALVSPRRSL